MISIGIKVVRRIDKKSIMAGKTIRVALFLAAKRFLAVKTERTQTAIMIRVVKSIGITR